MLIQDSLTGRLHEIPDQLYRSYLGECGRVYGQQYPQGSGHSPHYGPGQVVYDGLGNPVGIAPLLAMLAPLAAKVLPAIADKVLPVITKVLPAITQALPGISNILPGAAPAAPQPPAAMSPAPDQQFAPSAATPMPAPVQAPAPPMMQTPAPMPIQTPFPPVMATPAMAPLRPMPVPYPMMAMMTPRGIRGRRHRGRRPIRRRIAVPPPPPPEVMEPVRGAVIAEPSGAVQGWGYYGGFNGYRWR
jgi:hypothetical protein